MHARKTMIKGSPEQTEQARQVIESHVIPKAKELRGFRGGYWLIDREAGETMSFTFFDTKKDLEASEDAAAQLRSSGVAQIQGASVAGVHNYEVGLSTGEKVHDRASHARVLTFEGDPNDVDRAITAIGENVVPALKQVPGFLGGFWLVDRDSAKGIGVTLFDSGASITGSRERAAALRSQTAERIGGKVGEFREYEVLARAATPAGAAAG